MPPPQCTRHRKPITRDANPVSHTQESQNQSLRVGSIWGLLGNEQGPHAGEAKFVREDFAKELSLPLFPAVCESSRWCKTE